MWVNILPNASPCARLTGRPNKLKRQRLHQRKDYCKAMPGEWVASAQKTPDFPDEFQQSIIKGQVTEAGWGGGGVSQGVWLAHAQFSDWLMLRYGG